MSNGMRLSLRKQQSCRPVGFLQTEITVAPDPKPLELPAILLT